MLELLLRGKDDVATRGGKQVLKYTRKGEKQDTGKQDRHYKNKTGNTMNKHILYNGKAASGNLMGPDTDKVLTL